MIPRQPGFVQRAAGERVPSLYTMRASRQQALGIVQHAEAGAEQCGNDGFELPREAGSGQELGMDGGRAVEGSEETCYLEGADEAVVVGDSAPGPEIAVAEPALSFAGTGGQEAHGVVEEAAHGDERV